MVSIIGRWSPILSRRKFKKQKKEKQNQPKNKILQKRFFTVIWLALLVGEYANHSAERIMKKRVRMYIQKR